MEFGATSDAPNEAVDSDVADRPSEYSPSRGIPTTTIVIGVVLLCLAISIFSLVSFVNSQRKRTPQTLTERINAIGEKWRAFADTAPVPVKPLSAAERIEWNKYRSMVKNQRAGPLINNTAFFLVGLRANGWQFWGFDEKGGWQHGFSDTPIPIAFQQSVGFDEANKIASEQVAAPGVKAFVVVDLLSQSDPTALRWHIHDGRRSISTEKPPSSETGRSLNDFLTSFQRSVSGS
jgi:hypothetical protein